MDRGLGVSVPRWEIDDAAHNTNTPREVIYICVPMYIYVCIYLCLYTYMKCMYLHVYKYIYTYIHICLYAYVHH